MFELVNIGCSFVRIVGELLLTGFKNFSRFGVDSNFLVVWLEVNTQELDHFLLDKDLLVREGPFVILKVVKFNRILGSFLN